MEPGNITNFQDADTPELRHSGSQARSTHDKVQSLDDAQLRSVVLPYSCRVRCEDARAVSTAVILASPLADAQSSRDFQGTAHQACHRWRQMLRALRCARQCDASNWEAYFNLTSHLFAL